jgi:hypothetical protein
MTCFRSRESAALEFYGDYARDFAVNPNQGNLQYCVEPIWTTRWDEAMGLLYPDSQRPPVPRTYMWSPQPREIADDDMRNTFWIDYFTFMRTIRKGGLFAHNAITVQAMQLMHSMFRMDPWDISKAGRVTDLMYRWLYDDNCDMLHITPNNIINGTAATIERLQLAQELPERD